MRIYDPRINRWISPDPYRQYHSPYMAMDNTPQQSTDPDGGCTTCPKDAKFGDTYNHSEFGKLTFGKHGWADGNGNNILNDISLTFSATKNLDGSLKNWNNVNWSLADTKGLQILAEQRAASTKAWKPVLQGLAVAMAAPVVIPGLVASTPYAKSAFSVSSRFKTAQFAYSAISEGISNKGNLRKVNLVEIGLSTYIGGNGADAIGSIVKVSIDGGVKLNTLDASMVNFLAAKAGKGFHSNILKTSSELGGKGAVKGLEYTFSTLGYTLPKFFSNNN